MASSATDLTGEAARPRPKRAPSAHCPTASPDRLNPDRRICHRVEGSSSAHYLYMKKILIILGQTATGKSSIAVRLAKKYRGEIISADSRQVYKDLNIATGKVTKKEMQGVPHHMLSIISPKKIFSVAEWQKQTKKIITQIHNRDRLPIICGGTGFYIKSIVENVVLPDVPPNIKLRKKLDGKTAEELSRILKRLDPKILSKIDRQNPVRLVRAIEIASSLGYIPKIRTEKPQYDILQIGLKLPKKMLDDKIKERVKTRIRAGMFSEGSRLYNGGLSFKRMRILGLEYRLLADFLEKKISRDDFIKQLEVADTQYARRQWQWFKKDKKIKWFSPNNIRKIEKVVDDFLDK